jgi:hypothetical protein
MIVIASAESARQSRDSGKSGPGLPRRRFAPPRNDGEKWIGLFHLSLGSFALIFTSEYWWG